MSEAWCLFAAAGLFVVASAVSLYVVHLRRQNHRLRQSEAESRGRMMAQQLRHHFLFNTLNTTACLINTRPNLATHILTDLSELFRAMLQHKSAITLAEETQFVRRYLRIERNRLGGRLGVAWRVPDAGHLRVKVPPMTLQPLVENAIYHGIETRKQGGVVYIGIEAREKRTIVHIRNPVEDAVSTGRAEGNRLAQKRVAERLFHTYGAAARFTRELHCGEYRVTFFIPREVP